MHTRPFVRALAVPTAGALLALAAAPGFADVTDGGAVANGSAGAATINGNAITGVYVVENDGPTTANQTSTGSNQAPLALLDGTSLPSVGTLAQDALTEIDADGSGFSWACSGVAGDGASLANVGDGGSCLAGGDQVALDAGALDLTDVTVISNEELATALEPVLEGLDPVLTGLNGVLQQVADGASEIGAALGNPSLFVNLGAVQAFCDASPTVANGDANIADAGAYAEFNGEQIPIINLPPTPPPNTHLVTDLEAVVAAILDAVEVHLGTLLNDTLTVESLKAALGALTLGELGIGGADLPLPLPDTTTLADALDALEAAGLSTAPLDAALQGILGQIRPPLEQQILGQVGDGLAPLEENILDVTLNAQHDAAGTLVEYTTDDAIHVTALRIELLPAAADVMGSAALDVEIGDVTCGPNNVFQRADATPALQQAQAPSSAPTTAPTAVPTAIPAGLESAGGVGTAGTLAVGGLLVLAMAAGTVAYRRSMS